VSRYVNSQRGPLGKKRGVRARPGDNFNFLMPIVTVSIIPTLFLELPTFAVFQSGICYSVTGTVGLRSNVTRYVPRAVPPRASTFLISDLHPLTSFYPCPICVNIYMTAGFAGNDASLNVENGHSATARRSPARQQRMIESSRASSTLN